MKYHVILQRPRGTVQYRVRASASQGWHTVMGPHAINLDPSVEQKDLGATVEIAVKLTTSAYKGFNVHVKKV